MTIDTIRSTSLRVLDAEDPNEFISAKNTRYIWLTERSITIQRVLKLTPSSFIRFTSFSHFSDVICELTPNLGQFGVYELSIVNRSCDIKVLNAPTYPYTGKAPCIK